MPKPIVECDFLINLPKFKAHPWCRLTLSLKNFIGIQDDRHRLVDHNQFLEHKIAEENAKYAAHRKQQVGSGERNEKIRTYNFPQNRVTDHRIGLTLYRLEGFIEGDIQEMIDALSAHYQAAAHSGSGA